jgi:hypothetical protein
MLWLVALGLGVQCAHPANKSGGAPFRIPSRWYSCEHFERRDPLPGWKATFEGDTAKIEMTIHHGAPFIDNLGIAAFNVAQKVYDAAKANPSAKKAEVKLTMSKQGLQDKYGNEWTEDREMGTITIADLDEVRKYTNGGRYASNEAVEGSSKAKIGGLKYAELLAKQDRA